MKFISLTFAVSTLLLVGFSDSDDNTAITIVGKPTDFDDNPLPDIPSVDYSDSTISLRYPSSWLVNPNGALPGVDAQITAPQTNAFGGVDNCGFFYTLDRSLSLLDAVDQILTVLAPVPEPQEKFLEVNAVPAARIRGNLAILNFNIPSIFQVMVSDGQQIFASCSATGTNDLASARIVKRNFWVMQVPPILQTNRDPTYLKTQSLLYKRTG